MKYFGKRHDAPIYDEVEAAATPIGEACGHCGEPIAAGDDGWLIPFAGEGERREIAEHRACFMRGIFGSVAHQQKRCSCYGGAGEDDHTLTRRQAAEAAVAYAYRNRADEP